MNCPTTAKCHILHAHTSMSILDGVSTVGEYIDYAVKNGLGACSCTDHGYILGLYELVTKANKAKIKPIPGIEAYLMPPDDYKFKGEPFDYFHITLWAMDMEGFRNLVLMSSKAWDDDKRIVYRFGRALARMTFEDLALYNRGIICGSGCIEGPIGKPYLHGEFDMAARNAYILKEIFGDRLYMEVLPHRVNKNYEYKAKIVEVTGEDGFKYRFSENDVLETDSGPMTALEAAKKKVEQVEAATPTRYQDRLILKTGEEMDRVIMAEDELVPADLSAFKVEREDYESQRAIVADLAERLPGQ